MNKHKKFGFSFGIALAVIGTFHLIIGNSHFLILYIVSCVVLLSASTFPVLLKPLFILFYWLGTGLGWLITTIVLLLLFYLVFTPLGLMLKILRKDFMGRKQKDSYWHAVNNKNTDYEKQY